MSRDLFPVFHARLVFSYFATRFVSEFDFEKTNKILVELKTITSFTAIPSWQTFYLHPSFIVALLIMTSQRTQFIQVCEAKEAFFF